MGLGSDLEWSCPKIVYKVYWICGRVALEQGLYFNLDRTCIVPVAGSCAQKKAFLHPQRPETPAFSMAPGAGVARAAESCPAQDGPSAG